MRHLIILQLLSVLAHVGTASGYPQLREFYGSAVLASSFLAAVPLAAMVAGPLWGPVARRMGTRRAVTLAVVGWSVTMFLLGATMGSPVVGIALRGLHGAFDVALVSLPLVAATRELSDAGERRRFFGFFETAASVGAIVGPLTVGVLMITSLRWAFIAIAAAGPLYLLAARPARDRAAGGAAGHSAPAPAADGAAAAGNPQGGATGPGPGTRGPIPREMIVPGIYAIGVLVLISANEAFLPEYVEREIGAAWMGKLAVAIYEILVIAGVTLKSRIDGTRMWPPAVTGAVFLAALLLSGWTAAVLVLLGATAVGIGMSLTMSHEFAAHRAAGDAEAGMTVYASMRISGAVIGPYVVALGFPILLLPLAAVSLASAPLLRGDRRRSRTAIAAE